MMRFWDCLACVVLLCGALAFLGTTEARENFSKPKTCDVSETWFRHRRRYVYQYQAEVVTGFTGTSADRTGSLLSCVVAVSVPKKCEATVELSGCKLKEMNSKGRLVASPRSSEIAAELEQNAVYVQMSRGEVMGHRMVVMGENQPGHVTNIQRAVVSQLQLPIKHVKEYRDTLTQHDIFGSCPMHVKFDGSSSSMRTHRDISTCQLPQLLGRHVSSFSFAKQLELKFLRQPIDTLINPFESIVDCDYKIGGKKIARSVCRHNQAFRPVTFDGYLRAATAVNVTQTLTFRSVSKQRKSNLARSLKGKRFVDLSMDMEVPSSPEATSQEVQEGLNELMRTYSAAEADKLPLEQFQSFMTTLRSSPVGVLDGTVDVLLECRKGPDVCQLDAYTGELDAKTVQSLRESFLTDGLLSCGSEACMAAYVTSSQRGLVHPRLGDVTLLNMAMFYSPAPQVIERLQTLCRSTDSHNCWLSLGTLTGRLADTMTSSPDGSDDSAGRAAVGEVLRGLRRALGDSCRRGALSGMSPPNRMAKTATVLLALKTLGNAGSAIALFHDDHVRGAGKELVPALLHCVTNTDLPDKIHSAALLALEKVELEKEDHDALFDVLSDASRRVSLRSVTFDRLLRHEDADCVQRLGDVIRQEVTDSLKVYMVTKVGHLLESNHPDYRSLRALWRTALSARPLPDLESLRGRGSQHAAFSRYVALPLVNAHNGAELGISVTFEPASLVPSHFRVAFSLVFNNQSVDVLDIGMDMQGMENIARSLLGPDMDLQQGLGSLVAQIMQAALPRKGALPTLSFHDGSVMAALRDLLLKVNMPTGDAPQAHMRVKVFGSEVGFLYLDDVIRMVKGQPSDKSPPQLMTYAQKLSEGLQLFLGKSSQLVEVEKAIPTVAGLPWHAKVKGTMVASVIFNAGGDVIKFMRRKGPLEISGGFTASVGVKVTCEMAVRLGQVTSSGARVNISVLVNAGSSGRLQYAPRPETKGSPGAQVLTLGLGALKRPLNLLSTRSDIFLLHNGEERAVQTPGTQRTTRLCTPGVVQKWTGQQTCVAGFYQHQNFTADNPVPIVSGPVHLDVTTASADTDLSEYTVTLTFTKEAAKVGSRGIVLVFKANCSAPGTLLQRALNVTVSVNPGTRELHVAAVVPEFALRYGLDLQYLASPRLSHTLLSSVLSVENSVVHSLVYEWLDQLETRGQEGGGEGYNVSSMQVKVNGSVPGMSLQVTANSSSGVQPGLFTQGLYVTYYCEPALGVLYQLHGRPALTGARGHVSRWSVSSAATIRGKSLAETMRGTYRLTALLPDTITIMSPGRNITLQNQMTGNYTYSHRDTVVYWTAEVGTPNQTTDVIRMESEVRNQFVAQHYNMTYIMTLIHEDKYDVKMAGRITGPLNDLEFKSNITYTAVAPNVRARRSLSGIHRHLRRVEEEVVALVETAEQAVVRKGAQLTEAFLSWVSGGSAAEVTAFRGQQAAAEASEGNQTEEDQVTPPEGAQGSPQGALQGALASLRHIPMGPHIGALTQIFTRDTAVLHIDAHLKVMPREAAHSGDSPGNQYSWDMDISLPEEQQHLFFFNGTLSRGDDWDMDADWRLHSDLLNFTLTYFMQQSIHYPVVFHTHRWNLVEFTQHRYDRSFALHMDLQRYDHFVYSLDVTSPHTNVSHAINFSTLPDVRSVRASLDLHRNSPEIDINYRESSNLTARGLTTEISLNSTWIDLTLDMDVSMSPRTGVTVSQRIQSFGKVAFLNGSNALEVTVKLDPSNKRRPPSMSITHTGETGVVSATRGQLMGPHHVHYTFTSQKPEGRKVPLLSWDIHLREPTSLEHSLTWEPAMSQPLLGGAARFYRAGAHSFRTFGETVGDNVFRNVSDMVIPFTNTTISKVVDRVVQGQMREVALAGLDPKENVPLTSKLLTVGLRAVTDLQQYWQNSTTGRVATTLGLHYVVAGAAKLSTRLHYMVVQDPPFPLRQYVKFRVLPRLAHIQRDRRLVFSHPLPFVWPSFTTRPRPSLLKRQGARRVKIMTEGSMAEYPFLAIVSRDNIHTFDGVSYGVTVPDHQHCHYLLGTDVVRGNHSVLLSHHSATVAMRHAAVSVSWDGEVSVNHNEGHDIRELPTQLPADGASVTLTSGLTEVTIPGHMRMTFDPLTQIYIIEAAAHSHNRSVGMLGTNTRDKGDDFRLPTGEMTSDSAELMAQYELSGREVCKNAAAPVASPACDVKQTALCRKLFQQTDSSLAACFPLISPAQFMDLCADRACRGQGSLSSRVCPVASSYLRLCSSRAKQAGFTPDPLPTVQECDECSGQQKRVDVVFASALSGADLPKGGLANLVFGMASQLDSRARFGLVHTHEGHVHSHLFDGQLFVTSKELKSLDALEESAGAGPVKVKDVLRAACSFPFRPDARHLVVLFTGEQTPDLADSAELHKMMRGRGISLVLVSADLDSQRAMAVTWDQQVVCRNCDKKQLSLPTTEVGQLAAVTHGMWLSRDTLEKARRTRMRKLMKPFKVISAQLPPHCPAKGA